MSATHLLSSRPPVKGAVSASERGCLELNPPAFGHPPCQGGFEHHPQGVDRASDRLNAIG
jgi:hypothetical protein